MRPDLPAIPSHNLPTTARYAYYRGLVTAHGGTVAGDRDTVLGLRGLAPDGQRHPSHENTGPYNDTFVVLTRDGDVREYRGSAHAGQKSSSLVPQGVAQIRPGNYQTVYNGHHEGLPSWHVRQLDDSGRIPCWRDVDKNGLISDFEKKKAEAKGETATAILFHNGVNESHGRSIGCQTMPPRVMRSFIEQIGVGNEFLYTLIDANRPLPGSAPG